MEAIFPSSQPHHAALKTKFFNSTVRLNCTKKIYENKLSEFESYAQMGVHEAMAKVRTEMHDALDVYCDAFLAHMPIFDEAKAAGLLG